MPNPLNRGALLLKHKTSARGAKAALARALNVGADVVSHWLSADFRPDTKSRAYMEDELKISWRSWDEDVAPERVSEVEREIAESGVSPEPVEPFRGDRVA